MTSHLNVNEHFGPTIQGEGRHAGALASFIRLSGCNLSCAWCDTPYTWDWSRYDRAEESYRMEVDDAAEIMGHYPGRLVVTGGEPLMQRTALGHLLRSLPDREWDLETNGTRPLGETFALWSTVTASPKVTTSARQPLDRAGVIHPEIIERADFKFVVTDDDDDLQDVLMWLDEHPAIAPDRVWLMPEGTDVHTLTERTPMVMEAATANGFNFTSRLHVYGWGSARGH